MGQLENIQEFEKFKKMDKKIRKDFLSLCDPLQFDWRWKLWSLTVGQDFAKFMRIFSVNRTLIGSNTDSDDLAGVYKLLSRINHSCCPNVICQWRAETPLKIEVIAATSIRKGKELAVSYIGDDIFALDTYEERRQQLENWNFQCSCEVCSLSAEERDKNDKVRKFIQNHQIAPLESVDDLATIRSRLDKYLQVLVACLSIENETKHFLPLILTNCYMLYLSVKVMRISWECTTDVKQKLEDKLGANFMEVMGMVAMTKAEVVGSEMVKVVKGKMGIEH